MGSKGFGVRYNSDEVEGCSLLESFAAFCQLSFAILVILILMIAINWHQVSAFAMEHDLRHYAQAVRVASISLAEKEALLDLVEELQDRLDDGEQLDWWKWIHHNRTIRSLLEEGIDSDEVPLIERELKRISEGK